MITTSSSSSSNLVHDGHVYILETPLFRVRTRPRPIYCYSETERDAAVTKLGWASRRSTRFKGLGEISPKEFQQFIGKEMADEQSRIRRPRAESRPRSVQFLPWARTRQSAKTTFMVARFGFVLSPCPLLADMECERESNRHKGGRQRHDQAGDFLHPFRQPA